MTKVILSITLIIFIIPGAVGKTPHAYPNFKIELGLSYNEHLYDVSSPFEVSDLCFNDGICGEIHLLYNFKKGQAFTAGINYYEHVSAFSIPDESTNESDRLEDALFYRVIAVPFSYTIDKRINRKLLSFLEGGASLNFPLARHSNSPAFSSPDISYTLSPPKKLAITAFVKLGIKTPEKKGHYWKISGIANLPVKSVLLAECEYLTPSSNLSDAGTVTSAFGYYGFCLNYVFSLRNTLEKAKTFNSAANTWLEN